MARLLRSDFYRLFKSKSFYICTAVAFSLFCLSLLMVELVYHMSDSNKTMYANAIPKDGLSYGLSAFTDGSDAKMIIGIVIAIFVAAEFTHGTMKNVVSKGFSKIQIYLSKLITMIAAACIMLFVTSFVGTVFASIATGKVGHFSGDFVSQIFKTLGIEILLYAALVSLYVLVAMLVRNMGGAIAINIIVISMFAPIIFQLGDVISKNKIKFTNYSLINNITFYGIETAKGSDYLRSVIVALVFLAVTIALGMFAFVKSDVK